jgi:hypothetical protein
MIAGVGHCVSVGGHLTDLKIWLFAGSEEGKNIKNTTNLNFFHFLNVNINKN